MVYTNLRFPKDYKMPLAREFLKDLPYVLAGGALGSALRYMVSVFTNYDTSSPFPYKTLIVNIVGCFLAGFIVMYLEHHAFPNHVRLFLLIGFLGAFTTFSTFSLETVALYQAGHIRTALWNIVLSTVSCLTSVIAGFWLGLSLK